MDNTRLNKNSEKKTFSVAAALVDVAAGEVAGLGTGNLNLFNLPANCLIVEAGVVVDVAGQSNLTVDFGFAGGSELGNDLDIDGTGYVDVDIAASGNAETIQKAPRILTGTGKVVTAKFSAQPTAGKFTFIVHYVEYTKGNGELTNYGTGA